MRQYNTKKPALNYHQLSLLRDMAADEINAIIMYKKHLNASKNEDLNELIEEILIDEQAHFDILLDMIRMYDKVQGETYLKVKTSAEPINDYSHAQIPDDFDVEASLLREIEGELNAITEYEHILQQMPIQEVRDKILFIINDEKEHSEQLTKALNDIVKF